MRWRGVGTAESNGLVATSFALLFLSKGRRPVVIAKAKYEDGREWDLHAGGVPNLTRHIEKAWQRELSWQTIDLKQYPNVKRWYETIAARPAVQKGYKVPKDMGPVPMPA